ncbi:dual specificity phosphatase 29-like isoform X2 [Grus americana]|uniref:dual specificity phosphatase 29-like isoform X2 n=1 Tax=Grus americana TaxID=9117 RepID=UPI002408190A|nr:dual specificity phosphatase 29-like isoform X2 [Grus americana]
MPHTRDSAGSRASYKTPALSDLQRLFWFRGGSDNHVDQVWPNIYLGDAWAARSKATLQSLNITHILNAADGPYSINTGAKYYEDLQIEYYGVEAFDDPSFDLNIIFLYSMKIPLFERTFKYCSSSLIKIHPGDAVENASEEEGGFPAEAAWAVGASAGKHLTTKFKGFQICLTVQRYKTRDFLSQK